ncbi:tripartite tricarboxylate transporter TctB family protein [Halomonas sp. ML-15]|uniref:tripartite tricarboxylate transporter TctB family protein n=1 Tax=Halomonas sp. ML-15 TaxID=2773305 RepID=UPI0017462EB8|nr:tripartite tricarboxylate transporter TctB family protein [Halomonas sp. ML-15]MBD3894542.1 tripartite tricarboxylate transporter TctB family protein [Halomonas sp. ML-15]
MNVSRLSLGAFGVFLAIVFFVNNISYPTRAAQIPLIFSTTVGLLSLALIVQEVFAAKLRVRLSTSGSTSDGFAVDSKMRFNKEGVVKAFTVYAFALLYVYGISVVGYFIATAMFLAASLFVVRGISIKYASIGAMSLLLVIGLVFFHFLGLNMPALPSF